MKKQNKKTTKNISINVNQKETYLIRIVKTGEEIERFRLKASAIIYKKKKKKEIKEEMEIIRI